MSIRRRALFLTGLFVAVSCSDAGNPLEPGPRPRPGPVDALQVLQCAVNIPTATMQCAPPDASAGGAMGAGQMITGGQNKYVTLTASNFAPTASSLEFDVTVQSLMRQALGTSDGVTPHANGVRVWFAEDAVAQPTGSVTVDSMSGTGILLVNPQPYFQYDTILRTNETSTSKRWRFDFAGGATNITFKVYVVAEVQYPNGWVEVTPALDSLAPGETVDLNGIAYDARADSALPPSQTLTWSSNNPDVASVDAGTGLVTADSAGVAVITATNGTQSGTATIVVNTDPVFVVDTFPAITNVTIPEPAPGVLQGASDGDGQTVTVVPDTVTTSQGGTAWLNADGSLEYLSKAGFSGEDMIPFEITDGVTRRPAHAIVQVAASNYWYVRAGGTGDGRDRFPFGTLAQAQDSAAAGDSILVLDNGALTLAGPLTLEANQAIIGQGIPSSIVRTVNGQPITILAAGTQPELTSATGSTVTLGTDNVIKGVAIGSTAGAAGIAGTSFGSLRLWYANVGTAGPALVLSGGALDADSTVTVSSTGSPASGISLVNVTGSMTTTGGAISGAAAAAFSVAGGSVLVNYGGNVTQGNSAALLAVTGGHTGTLTFPGTLSATAGTGLQFNDADGAYNFTGTTTLNGGDAGVDIGNGSAGTFAFGTGTAITSPSGTAFAVNGSSPAVTYSGSITQANSALLVDVSEQPGGSVTFQTGTLSATNGAGVQLSNADGTVSFNGTTNLNGGDAAVDVLAGSGGTIGFAATTMINNPTGVGLLVFESEPVLTYAGSIAANAGRPVEVNGASPCGTVTVSGSITSTGQGILVQDCSAGTVSFTGGTKTLNTGANQGVTLANNAGATVSFSGGGLAITTTSATGFGATTGGAVQVTGANNSISTGTGTGLSLVGVGTGASGVTFRSVSTGAAANGIALSGLTGAGVTVTGDGSTAGSGGTISGTTGHGVSLGNLASLTAGVALNHLNVSTGAAGMSSVFGTTFGTLALAGNQLAATGGPALNLTTGTVSGTVASLSSSGSPTSGVSLTGVGGTLNATAGTIAGGVTGAFAVSGGTVGGTIGASVSQANASASVISVAGAHNTGTLTFSSTVSASNGTGLQFTDADGTYTFTGTTNLAGGDAGIDIAAASTGTVNVTPSGGNTATITSPSGIAIAILGGSADLNYSGSVSQANAQPLLSVSGGHNGDVAFPIGTINASNGTGLQFDNSDGTYVFGGTVTLAGGDAGIDVTNGSAGTFTFPTAATITSPSTGNLISILNSSPNFTYGGSLTKANNNVTAILVQSNTGGTITFNGDATSADGDPADVARSISSGTAAGVNLSSNGGATINFNGGGLSITSTSGAGFTAAGGGTINITGAGNTISSGAGTALNVQNTTIGASGLSFLSISHSGGANGIHLANTGATNGLQVTGNGTAGSGGSITNTTGGDGSTSGNGIYLNGTRTVNLSWMSLSGHANNGLFGTGVRGLTVNKVRFTGTNGTSNSGTFDESAVNLVDVGGPVKLTNSRFDGGAYNAVRVENGAGTAPVLDSLVVENDTVEFMQGSTADVRSTAVLVNLIDGSADVRIRNNRVTYWWGAAINVAVQGTASSTTRITNNFADNTNGALAGAAGIVVAGGNHAYNISGNTVRHTDGAGISADRVNFGTNMNGTISGNFIGVSGDNGSGSRNGSGIFASHHGPGTTTHRITNNTIRQVQAHSGSGAIWVLTGDASGFGGSGTLNATITGNNIQEHATLIAPINAHNGILATVGTQSAPVNDTDQVCLDIGGAGVLANTIANFNSNTNRIRVSARFGTTSRFPGYTGAQLGVTSQTDLGTYLVGRNPGTSSVNQNTSTGGFNNTVPANSACPQPTI